MPSFSVRASTAVCAIALFISLAARPAQAEIIVTSSGPYRLGGSQAGSQNASTVAPFGGNGSIAAWVSSSGANQFPYVGYYSIFGDPRGLAINLGSTAGLTTGAKATSTAAVAFSDASALIFFGAAARVGGGPDIFAQPMSAFRDKVGVPARINQILTDSQSRVFAVPLPNGKVLATWLTHAAAASSYNLRGRVVSASGGGAAGEVAVTLDTAGAQTQTGLAALTNGDSVIAYYVQTGSGATFKQSAYVQRLGPTGARLGNPRLIKQTTGPKTYGGVGVAALPAGRFIALWFVAASSGKATLKRQTFQANGTAGVVGTIGTAPLKATAQNAPKAILGKEGVMIAIDVFAGGTYGVNAALINTSGALIAAAKTIGIGTRPLASTSLGYDPLNKIYYLSWTQTISANSVHSFAGSFYVGNGCSVKC